MKVAVYPGTFDPVTNGHLDILKQALNVFDQVVVVVAQNIDKHPMFTVKERVEMFQLAVENLARVEILASEGLTVNQAIKLNAQAIVRGIRSISDLENESNMAMMNRDLAPSIITVSFFPGETLKHISSSFIKEIFKFGGDISSHVPGPALEAFLEKGNNTP
tara:strand:- start:65576 stop:66061 length:486 start_codon:yes stop_codon:yes gene_type:complete